MSPLYSTTLCNSHIVPLCQVLLVRGEADAYHCSDSGRTSLLEAASEGHTDCMTALIELGGADVNYVSEPGKEHALLLAAAGTAQLKPLGTASSPPAHPVLQGQPLSLFSCSRSCCRIAFSGSQGWGRGLSSSTRQHSWSCCLSGCRDQAPYLCLVHCKCTPCLVVCLVF